MKSSNSFVPAMMIVVGVIALLCLYLTAADEVVSMPSKGPVKLKVQSTYSPFDALRKSSDSEHTPFESDTITELPVAAHVKFAAPQLDQDAIATFGLSVWVDDPRSPPISRSLPYIGPSQAVLEDPQKYEEFESQRRRTTLTLFVAAATDKVAKLERLIAQGKARGISPQKLEEGMEKLAALKQGINTVKLEL